VTTCLLCSQPLDTAPVLATHARYGVACPRVACSACGLVQQLARLTDDEARAYYETAYRHEHKPLPIGGHEPGTPEHEELLDAIAARRASDAIDAFGLRDPASPGALHQASLLEVGCGDGRVAAKLLSYGLHVVAVEPDPGQREIAARRGVHAWDRLDKIGEGFEGIIAIHSLEHMPDPIAALAALRAHAIPGGHILIEVPCVECPYGAGLGEWFFQAPHVVDFSGPTLHACLVAAGWVGVEIHVDGAVLLARASAPAPEVAPPPREVALQQAGASPDHTAWVVGHLGAWDAARKAERALTVLLDGGEIDRPALCAAVERVHQQGAIAKATLDALHDGLAALVAEMEAQDRALDHERATDYARGYQAGRSATLAQVAQALGHTCNAAKAMEGR
jgi:SAM-dependent methyltransferase